jgi:hypothetical protein
MAFSRKSSGDAANAGGTDWDAKKQAVGSKAKPKNDRPYHAHDGETPGSGGSISDDQIMGDD